MRESLNLYEERTNLDILHKLINEEKVIEKSINYLNRNGAFKLKITSEEEFLSDVGLPIQNFFYFEKGTK